VGVEEEEEEVVAAHDVLRSVTTHVPNGEAVYHCVPRIWTTVHRFIHNGANSVVVSKRVANDADEHNRERMGVV